MLTDAWQNDVPMDSEVVAIAASRIRQFKRDVRERINENIPIGAIMEWFTETAPDGYLHCNGQSIAVSSYSDLFAIIGYSFGGSGANFNVPDMRGLFVRCWRHGKTGVDLDADSAVSCVGNISGTAISSVTGLAGVPRIGAVVTGTGISTDTYITAFTAYDANGIPTAMTISQAATTGSGIAITINNDVIGSVQYDENKTHNHSVSTRRFIPGEAPTLIHVGDLLNTSSSGGNESRPKNVAVMFIVRSDTI